MNIKHKTHNIKHKPFYVTQRPICIIASSRALQLTRYFSFNAASDLIEGRLFVCENKVQTCSGVQGPDYRWDGSTPLFILLFHLSETVQRFKPLSTGERSERRIVSSLLPSGILQIETERDGCEALTVMPRGAIQVMHSQRRLPGRKRSPSVHSGFLLVTNPQSSVIHSAFIFNFL